MQGGPTNKVDQTSYNYTLSISKLTVHFPI